MNDTPQLTILFVSLLGLTVGSFINALVWRMHERISIGGSSRSQCPDCRHKLAWYDLVPVFSWVALRGRCRYCRSKISIQYPVVEISNGLLWGLSVYILRPASLIDTIITIAWLMTVSILLVLAVYDTRWMILPGRLVMSFTVAVSGIAALTLLKDELSTFRAVDPLLGVLFIAGLFYVIFQLSDGKWIGGGDVKLAVGMGLLLGLDGSVAALFLASLAGSIFGIIAIALFKRGRKQLIPFGPFLIAATIVVFLFGDSLINWYLTSLLT